MRCSASGWELHRRGVIIIVLAMTGDVEHRVQPAGSAQRLWRLAIGRLVRAVRGRGCPSSDLRGTCGTCVPGRKNRSGLDASSTPGVSLYRDLGRVGRGVETVFQCFSCSDSHPEVHACTVPSAASRPWRGSQSLSSRRSSSHSSSQLRSPRRKYQTSSATTGLQRYRRGDPGAEQRKPL